MSNKDKVLQLLKTNPKISFEKAKAALPGVRPNVIAIVMKGASGKKKPAKKMPKWSFAAEMAVKKKSLRVSEGELVGKKISREVFELEAVITEMLGVLSMNGCLWEMRVIKGIVERLRVGLERYGRLELNADKRDFAREANEEMLDLVVYREIGRLKS
jgi:hypothetical protein